MSVVNEKKSPEVRLTKRKLEILSALERWGILGLGQMTGLLFNQGVDAEERMELFFKTTGKDDYDGGAYKAIKKLVRGGYVRGHSFTNLLKAYTLTGRGHAELRKRGMHKLSSYCGEVAETMVRHELLVSAVGLALSAIRHLAVQTEMERYVARMVRAAQGRPGDAACSDLWIEDRREPKAVEIERTQKSARRYEELWMEYRQNLPPSGVVLYIACFPGGAKALLRLAEKLRADHVYVCDLEDFKASLGRGPFVGYRGGRIALESPLDIPIPSSIEPAPAQQSGPVPLLARPEFQIKRDWRRQ